jgi:O-antigen/teichoic acid export membrane protein
MTSLKDKTISGMGWSLLQSIGGRSISFMVMIILARLLTPENFGLIGVLLIFIQLSQSLIVAGFNQALIQNKDTDEEDYSSVFWINLAVSIILYMILFLTAPLIAAFYNQPILTNLARVLSLVFVINSFSFVQETRLSKEMRFKILSIINIPSLVLGGAVSVIMALNGFGVWSIVAMQLVSRLAYVIQIWLFSKWKPQFIFNIIKVKKLLSFGSKLMFSEIIHIFYQNIYLVIIGKFYPLSSVGYYQNASNLVNTPSYTLSGALNLVAFPVFSSIQDDNRRLKAGFKKIIQHALFWVTPIFVLAGVLAEPLFRFVFTEKWLPAVPYFQWLCIVGIFTPINSFNLNILNVKGRSDLFLKLEILKKAIITIGIIAAIPFGIMALIIFQAVNSILMFLINSYYSGRFIQYSILEQLKDVMSIFLLSIGVGIIIYFLNQTQLGFSDFVQLFFGFGVGVILYWISAKYWKFTPYLDIQHILKTKFSKHFHK